MNYNELIEELKNKFEINSIIKGNLPKILNIYLIDNNIINWDENTLYIGKASDIKNMPDRPIMLISTDICPPLPMGSNCSKINEKDLYSIFNFAKDLIFENLQVESILFSLTEKALEGRSIVYLINTAASILGNALILVDIKGNILAYSTNYEIVDPLWMENIKRGSYTDDFIDKLHSSTDLRRWSKKGSESHFITFPGDKQRKLVSRITREGHLAGALVMVEHHTPINPLHTLLLPKISKLLFNIFSKDQTSVEASKAFYTTLLNNLLDEKDSFDTTEILSILKDYFTEEMYVIAARFIHPVKNRYLKHIVNMELNQIFPSGYILRHKGYMVDLVPNISHGDRDKLKKLAKKENIIIGISWPFTNISKLKGHLDQAIASIKFAQTFQMKERVIDYTYVSFYDLLQKHKGKIDLKQFSHPALKVLREYDKRNNAELYKTLRIYLECNNNIQQTANKLFIHRNSLIYRLNRIKEITGLDIENYNVAHSLIDSYRIEDFITNMDL